MADPQNAQDFRELIQMQRYPTGVLDVTVDYLRARGMHLLPIYFLAMLPMTVLMLFIIDAVCAEHRSVIAMYSLLLVPAMIWRWAGLSMLQRAVQQQLQARPGLPLMKNMSRILLLKLYSHIAFSWGSMVILPGFYGWFSAGFATPLLLENDGPVEVETRRVLGWIHHAAARLSRVMLSLSIILLIMTLATFLLQYILVEFILPSLLAIDASSIAVTFKSWSWRLSVFYFLFLIFDFFWTVACVFLYYDSQTRRTGADLAARLQLATQGTSP